MPTDNHDLGKSVGNTKPSTERQEGSPGYETTDVNVGGVVVFLAGLSGFLLIFFLFCFVMGKAINTAFVREDGPVDMWHKNAPYAYANPGDVGGTATRKRENLASSPEMGQREMQRVTTDFPSPRLDVDDGNQATADLHAREDLLLDNYSSEPNGNGTIRIPISRAMDLIAQRGLPLAPTVAKEGTQMAGDPSRAITLPLTQGFARTGYELDVMEARAQKLSYGKEAASSHAELKPLR